MKLKLLRLIKKVMLYLLQIGYRVLCMFIPVSDKKIVFMSFHGRGYGDNPKAIYEEMKKDERLRIIHLFGFYEIFKKHLKAQSVFIICDGHILLRWLQVNTGL